MGQAVENVRNLNISYLSVDKIRPNPYQPRKYFDKQALEDLAKSIKEYGVMQPINVRFINNNSYELVAGERRLRASRMAGLTVIPAIIIDITDKESAVLALIENIQRQNLNYLEEAEGFANLMNDYGLTQEELASKIGKSQSTVANKLRLLRFSGNVKRMLVDNNLTERHARAMLKITNEQTQLSLLSKVVERGLTVSKTEELVENAIKRQSKQTLKRSNTKFKLHVRDIRLFTNTIENAVAMMKKAGIKTEYTINTADGVYDINIKVRME